jgi:large subunit ribosomal protein L16
MKFLPKKQKHKKQQKRKKSNFVGPVNTLNNKCYNTLSLKTLNFGRITGKQLEAMYKCINKHIKKFGRVILRIFPQTPITKKPTEVRMGKGKGNVSFWVVKIKSGIVICEIETNSILLAIKALKQAQKKISIKTKIVFSYD